ncbi:hypothetical protein [Shewanella algae]
MNGGVLAEVKATFMGDMGVAIEGDVAVVRLSPVKYGVCCS